MAPHGTEFFVSSNAVTVRDEGDLCNVLSAIHDSGVDGLGENLSMIVLYSIACLHGFVFIVFWSCACVGIFVSSCVETFFHVCARFVCCSDAP